MRALAAVASICLLSGLPSVAWGAAAGDGDLVATFDASLQPKALPRSRSVPVSVRVAGNVRSESGNLLAVPQLQKISVAINNQGRLFDRGLPSCAAEAIQPATPAKALAECSSALVGSGHVGVLVRLPDQPPYMVHARLLAFNGPRSNGRRVILAQAYSSVPPGAFILKFHLRTRPGSFGTVLSTSLPPTTRKWAYLTHFDMTLHRTYVFGGRRRSYVSAACSAPPGFDKVLFPFAKVSYTFGTGQRLTMSEATTCRVAG
jgi:hypothetical protein